MVNIAYPTRVKVSIRKRIKRQLRYIGKCAKCITVDIPVAAASLIISCCDCYMLAGSNVMIKRLRMAYVLLPPFAGLPAIQLSIEPWPFFFPSRGFSTLMISGGNPGLRGRPPPPGMPGGGPCQVGGGGGFMLPPGRRPGGAIPAGGPCRPE
jgi:hypothetical protein